MIAFLLAHWVAFAIASFVASVLSFASFFGMFGAAATDRARSFVGATGSCIFFALLSSLLGLFACVGLFVDVFNYVSAR